MRRTIGLVAALALAGCGKPAPENGTVTNVDGTAVDDLLTNNSFEAVPPDETAPLVENGSDAVPPVEPIEPGKPGGLPDDRTPISEAPFTKDSAQGAADVVQTYYALIGEKKYSQAYDLWEPGGAGMTRDAYVASFGKYTQYNAQVGAPGRIDSGAGQRYVEVPVQVYGRLKSGEPMHMLGKVTLHRAADIDGATAAQKSWRIKSTDIKPRP